MAALDIAENDLDAYALDRLAEPDAAPVEEHLLVCEERRERLAGWDEHVGRCGLRRGFRIRWSFRRSRRKTCANTYRAKL